ncbi:sterol O-acyltransferase 1 isoform X2 [Monomorium pharaonis]|uniref:sterol O-acyltransferase 1 isoform X2 n=1 Tax=Monomorium pharaonis TaxID=307658 RepID=UPI001745DEF0|nr:sterol O-acyltransferase 1 isoform X2 [Monomorium pharaonis]
MYWTDKIRWMVVIWKFVEVGAGIFCLAFIVERFITPTYCAFNTQYLDWKWFIKSYIKAYISGILFLIIGHYVLLHAWMNAWAEMLRFGDRLFYKDWWNCTTYREYYRTWNIVVHNWLYTYVYKDMYEIVVPGKRTLSSAMVFFISAIFHELVIAFSLRFFYPVLFILFGIIGYIFFFIRKYTSNVFMQLGLGFGMSIMFNLYSMEACARWNNCPSHPNYYLDLFIPRSWSCLK